MQIKFIVKIILPTLLAISLSACTESSSSDSADGCGSETISPCLNALQESDPITAGELDTFLWKPQADSDNNLAIHTGPSRTTVTVNGEVGINQGAGNGYGSLARFSKPS